MIFFVTTVLLLPHIVGAKVYVLHDECLFLMTKLTTDNVCFRTIDEL